MADVKYFAQLPPIVTVIGSRILAVQSDPTGTQGWKMTIDECSDYTVVTKTYSGLNTTNKTVQGSINEVKASVPVITVNSSNPSNPYYFAGLVIDSDGKTAFTISTAPGSNETFKLYLNGVLTADYTLTGTSLTWTGISLVSPGSPGDPDEFTAIINDGGVGAQAVTSVFTRTGAITAQSGDYTVAQITGAAASGANSDITSLSGLTTPLSIAQGGTNIGTALTNGKIMISSAGTIIEGPSTSAIPTTWSNITVAEGNLNYNNRRVRAIGATGSYRLNFIVPKHFTGTLAVKLIGYPVSGAGGTGRDIDLSGEYTLTAAASATQYTFSDTTSTYNTGTDDTRMELDITSLFTNLAAGAEGGILVDHNGIGGTINYVGVEITNT